MGGWKQKSGWIQIPPPPLAFLSLFPFYLIYLFVSLPRVCAPTLPLTNTYIIHYSTGSSIFNISTVVLILFYTTITVVVVR